MSFIQPRIKIALAVTCFIAANASADQPLSGANIAAHYGMKPRALEAILQTLARAGILKAIRGKDGGYYAAQPDVQTLADVAIAMLGSADNAPEKVFDDVPSYLKPPLYAAQAAWLNSLREASIASVADKIAATDPLQDFDFCI